MAAAAALATVRTIRDEGLLENARAVGEHLAARLRDVPGVTVVRGHGLLVGLDLVQGAPDDAVAPRLVAAARDAGFLVNATGPATVRLAPPLIVTRQEVDTFVSALPDLLRTVSST